MKIRLTATGTRPLLLHNVQLASPLNRYAKALKSANSKRTKTDDDRVAIARIEFEGSLYIDPEVGPYIPGQNVLASLVEGARLTKAGKKVERGVMVDDLVLPLIYRGPRDVEGLWGGGESEFVDMRTVVVMRAKIDRCRPVFKDWAFEADITIDPSVLDLDEFEEIARNAGAMAGIGDYRRLFGRYSSRVEAL
jgi:hypothetical protein